MPGAMLTIPEVPEGTLQRAEEIGLFHPTAARIQQVAANPETVVADLARTIAMDPLLAARLLKLANSPFYGFSGRITTLHHAIGLLGFRTTRDLAIAMYVGGKAERAGPEARTIWKHSLTTGSICRLLARYVRGIDASQALIAGLLQDVGALIMCILEPKYAAMHRHFELGSPRILQGELVLFGVQHTTLGASLLRSWELPDLFVEAALFHHEPPNTDHQWLMFLAGTIAERSLTKARELAETPAAKRLKLSETQLQIVLNVYAENASLIRGLR